ncbi:MAG: protein kinase domain-containing protein [Methanococcaceae archaeon]
MVIGQIISHYRIIEKLGGGGMGEVYKAEDIKLKRTAALKFLPVSFNRDEESEQRFIEEAQNASSLDHPNICTIYEIDEVRDFNDIPRKLFIAMAYYEGETLKDRIRSKSINISDAVEIAIQVAKGLAKAHQQSIIHRDIKPDNIIITNDGVAKIVDFGLARLTGRNEITRPGITMGTLSYISPEQIQGRKIDHRTDMWSFGIMLYEMLTGELPFRGEIDQAKIYSILNEAPEPFRINIPEQLKKIVYRTLEKIPHDRYSKMEEVITELLDVQSGNCYVQKEKHKISIAVLPFKNMSEDESQEYFCDGMAEEIINALTAVKGLRVIARTSSFSFKKKEIDIREIGRKLNVEMILEGSVRKTSDRLRITAQLINVSDGCHIWSEKFDRTFEDVLSVQDEISMLIMEKLKIELLEDEKNKVMTHETENLEAYNLYLLGRFYMTKNSRADLEKAIENFYKASEKDVNFLKLYFCIVAVYGTLIGYYQFSDKKIAAKALEAVNRALCLDPDAIYTHLTLASYHLNFTRNWKMAKAELEKVKQREPSNVSMHHQFSVYYFFTADFENAISEEKLAQLDDPLCIESILRLGVSYLRARNTIEASRQFLMVIELEPYYYFGYWMLGQTCILDGNFEKGIELLNKASELSKEDELIVADMSRAYALSGNKKMSEIILERLISQNNKERLHPYSFVTVYCALGRMDEAFYWMEKTFEEQDPAFFNLLGAESLDNLRKDPRFGIILKKYGFEKYYKIR